MDKKIVKAMYTNIVGKEEVPPIMKGVHFEKGRCYATDSHILVVYKEGNSKLDGKTIDLSGTELSGRYPNIDSVIPKDTSLQKFGSRIDLEQMQKACSWHLRQAGSTKNDAVVIEGICYNINLLNKVLNVFFAANELKNATMHKNDKTRPSVIKSKNIDAVIMPVTYSESSVDEERKPEGSVIRSYENFINTYVFEGWKKAPVVAELSWL